MNYLVDRHRFVFRGHGEIAMCHPRQATRAAASHRDRNVNLTACRRISNTGFVRAEIAVQSTLKSCKPVGVCEVDCSGSTAVELDCGDDGVNVHCDAIG